MRMPAAFPVSALLTATLLAQGPDPATQARARLQKALAATAAQPAGAFAAKWGAVANAAAQQQNANVVVFLGAMGGSHPPGAATGSWTPGLLQLSYEDNVELAFAGRRMIAKDANTPWCLRREVAADGAPLPFVPDVPYLLQQLARQDLTVTHQEVGTRDDRPVEILSVTLSADQVTDALWGGLMPKPAAGFGGVAFRAVGAAGAQKPVPSKPEATVDIAIALDPATAVVQSITVRSYQKEDQRMRAAFAGGNGGVVQVVRGNGGGNDASDEDEDEAKVDPKAPLQYEAGLPVRSQQRMTVWDYSIELRDLGTARPAELPVAAKALLGLQ